MKRTFKNLLVTGGAGFIGSNFIRYVFEKTDFSGRIVNFDALTYAGNPRSLDDVAAKYGDRYVFLHADIRDPAAIRKAFADYEDRKAWGRKMLVNIAQAGFFSSDRTIAQYNEDIWKL